MNGKKHKLTRRFLAMLLTLAMLSSMAPAAFATDGDTITIGGYEGPVVPAEPEEIDLSTASLEDVSDLLETAKVAQSEANAVKSVWSANFTQAMDELEFGSDILKQVSQQYSQASDCSDAWDDWVEALQERYDELLADQCTCPNNEYGCSEGYVDENCVVCSENPELCKKAPLFSSSYWQFYYDTDTSSGLLRIMGDYDNTSWPWATNNYYVGAAQQQMKYVIRDIVVEDNVTKIGENMFASLPKINSIEFGSGITQWVPERGPENRTGIFNNGMSSQYIGTITIKSAILDPVIFLNNFYPDNKDVCKIDTLILDNPDMVVVDRENASVIDVKNIDLKNVKEIGAYSFATSTVENLTIGNVEKIEESAFSDCKKLTGEIEIPASCTYVGGLAFNNCEKITKLIVPSTTKLGYSDVFENDVDYFTRMEALLDGQFSLGDVSNDDELTVSDEWMDSKVGTENSTAQNGTQITKAAKWADEQSTVADVELQFSYTKTPGKDFLFVVDYSESMANIGNATEDMDSRYSDMQSKLLDVSEELLTKEGYDNRVGFVQFSSDVVATKDFGGSFDTISSTVKDTLPDGLTNYGAALQKASDMISARTDKSREAVVIFISDGQPNRLANGNSGDWTQINTELEAITNELKAIQQNGQNTKLFGVLQSVPDNEQASCEAVMKNICTDGLFFNAEDTQEFSEAVNDVIGASFGQFVITDVVDEDFNLDENSLEASFGNASYDDRTRTITWDLTGALPYKDYTLTFKENLKQINGEYPSGKFDTNAQDAIVEESEIEVNHVATPQLPRGNTVMITPADITVYTGGEGYESVVDNVGEETEVQSSGLPTPGYLITLPEYINEQYFDGEQIAKNLSGQVRFVYDGNNDGAYIDAESDRIWELELYSENQSLTAKNEDGIARYVYRMDADSLSDVPIRMLFSNGSEEVISDDFKISLEDGLYREYGMTIYPGLLDENKIKAQVLVNGTVVEKNLDVEVGTATLTVRGTTDDKDINVVGNDTGAVVNNDHNITAVAPNDTQYYINESQVSVNPEDVSLLSNALVDTEPLKDYMVDNGIAENDENYEYRYLDLVDNTNGNAYVTATKPVDVYWALPEGADPDDDFRIVHFNALDREYDDLNEMLAENEPVVYSMGDDLEIVEIDNEEYLKFSTDSFSPFVLVWDEKNDQPPIIPSDPDDPDTPALDRVNHFLYVEGYPEDYRTGEYSGNEDLWPVKPQGNITRAEVATIFYRLLKDEVREEIETDVSNFPDVDKDDWFNVTVSSLANMGAISGYEDGTFRPNEPISRAELAAMAVRFYDAFEAEYEEGTFLDVDGDEWYADAIAAAEELGILGGYPDGTVRPNNNITRAETCAIVNRVLERRPHDEHLGDVDDMRTWPDNQPGAWYYADMQEATNGHYYKWIDIDGVDFEEWIEVDKDYDWTKR